MRVDWQMFPLVFFGEAHNKNALSGILSHITSVNATLHFI